MLPRALAVLLSLSSALAVAAADTTDFLALSATVRRGCAPCTRGEALAAAVAKTATDAKIPLFAALAVYHHSGFAVMADGLVKEGAVRDAEDYVAACDSDTIGMFELWFSLAREAGVKPRPETVRRYVMPRSRFSGREAVNMTRWRTAAWCDNLEQVLELVKRSEEYDTRDMVLDGFYIELFNTCTKGGIRPVYVAEYLCWMGEELAKLLEREKESPRLRDVEKSTCEQWLREDLPYYLKLLREAGK